MRSRIACSALVALASASALAAPARAEPTPTERAEPTPTERAMADGLFRDAKKLLARGKTPEACEKLAASYHIDPAGGTLLNLAMCHEIEGKTASAWTEFSEALAAARKGARADREKAARQHLETLEPRLSRVTVTVPAESAAAGLEVKIDGIVIQATALGTPIPVDPGDHTASAAAPDRKPWEEKVSLREAESRTLTVPPLDPTSAPAPPPPPPPTPWKRPAGIAAAGAGVVLLAVGAGFGARAITLGSRAGDGCPNLLCTPAGLSAVSEGRSAAGVANGTLAAGGALAAAGVVLLVLSAASGETRETRETRETGGAAPRSGSVFRNVEVQPALAPGLLLLSAGGAF
jgi:hypothetical protein